MTAAIKGGCLCGSVRFEGDLADGAKISACHCSMCRRWSSGPFLCFHFDKGVTLAESEGLSWYSASEWGERGFCHCCGTNLFWRLKGKDDTNWAVSVGSLDQVPKAKMHEHIFVDDAPGYYRFDDAAKRLSGQEVIDAFLSQQNA